MLFCRVTSSFLSLGYKEVCATQLHFEVSAVYSSHGGVMGGRVLREGRKAIGAGHESCNILEE